MCSCCDKKSDLTLLNDVMDKYASIPGSLITILQKAQEIYGYLPIEVQRIVAAELNVPLEDLYGISTFYAQFSLSPKGEYNISVCLGTACYVKGSGDIIEKFSEKLNVPIGSTSADGKYSIEATRCIGACGLAPVLTVNEEVYGRLGVDDVAGIEIYAVFFNLNIDVVAVPNAVIGCAAYGLVVFNAAPVSAPAAVCGKLELICKGSSYVIEGDLIDAGFNLSHHVGVVSGIPPCAVEPVAFAVTNRTDTFDFESGRHRNAVACNCDFLGVCVKGDGYITSCIYVEYEVVAVVAV